MHSTLYANQTLLGGFASTGTLKCGLAAGKNLFLGGYEKFLIKFDLMAKKAEKIYLVHDLVGISAFEGS